MYDAGYGCVAGSGGLQDVKAGAPCDARPQSGIEAGRVDDVGVQRVEREIGDPEGDPTVWLRAVPDLGERRAAVVRLIDTGLVRSGLEAARAAVADHVREAANPESRADEQVARVPRVDHDRVDAAAEERVDPGRCARVRRGAHARVLQLLPVLAAVGRLVDADAGLAAGRAAVRLAGAEVERVVLAVLAPGRERQRPNRVLVEIVRAHLLPRRVRGDRVVRVPDAAACDSGPQLALLRAAVRVGDERRHAARRV